MVSPRVSENEEGANVLPERRTGKPEARRRTSYEHSYEGLFHRLPAPVILALGILLWPKRVRLDLDSISVSLLLVDLDLSKLALSLLGSNSRMTLVVSIASSSL